MFNKLAYELFIPQCLININIVEIIKPNFDILGKYAPSKRCQFVFGQIKNKRVVSGVIELSCARCSRANGSRITGMYHSFIFRHSSSKLPLINTQNNTTCGSTLRRYGMYQILFECFTHKYEIQKICFRSSSILSSTVVTF